MEQELDDVVELLRILVQMAGHHVGTSHAIALLPASGREMPIINANGLPTARIAHIHV